MKNSREYVSAIKKLYRSLRRKYPKSQKPIYDDPVDAIVYAIISENLSKTTTKAAIKKIEGSFIDLNDLRVSLIEEIVEVLDENTITTRNIASTIKKVLGAIFSEYHKVSLKHLKKIGKRPARQILAKIDGITDFIVDYCVLTSLEGHAVPLTEKMIKYLKDNGLIHLESSKKDIEGFLAKQISAQNSYDFYILLRHESDLQKAEPNQKPEIKTSVKKTKNRERVAARNVKPHIEVGYSSRKSAEGNNRTF